MAVIREPARDVPVVEECELCVVGGSTTGVFAAVAAARLGLRVALVEGLGFFGGTATASLVCVWHTHLDTRLEKPILGGLVLETVDRLRARQALADLQPSWAKHYVFPPSELALVLDQLIAEENIRPFLHTRFVAPVVEDGRVTAAIIEDKSGRRAIRARIFVDATGDADLAHRAGLACFRDERLQPPTTCALFAGLEGLECGPRLNRVVFDPRYREALPPGFLWGSEVPGAGLWMIAGTRVHGADCADADQLTAAELAGRRQVDQMLQLLRRHIPGGEGVSLQGLPARIGIRQTRQVVCRHRLSEDEVLWGRRFDDAIANGSYRVDIHSADGDGLLFKMLDGTQQYVWADGRCENGRWREPVAEDPTFYQIPYRCLVPRDSRNVLVAGRCIDTDRGAFGAIRVMVNASQTGHAAGVAAALAVQGDREVGEVEPQRLRRLLTEQGAVIL